MTPVDFWTRMLFTSILVSLVFAMGWGVEGPAQRWCARGAGFAVLVALVSLTALIWVAP